MPTEPLTIEQFGGLNLIDDPLEVGTKATVDAVNVDVDRLGRLRARDGFSRFVALTLTLDTGDGEGLAAFSSLIASQILVGYSNGGTKTYAAYNTAGSLVSSTAVTSAYMSSAYGTTGSTQYLYIANGNGSDTIRRWSGSAFSSPAGMPKATYLASVPVSGRLAAGSTAVTELSRVKFSAPYNAESWGVSDFVDLNPGDGLLTGLHSWRDMVVAIKQRQFFVFQGESVDGDGGTIFNYRTIDGYGGTNSVVGDEGVYFGDGHVVWLTTGGVPVRVSRPVEPFLRGEVAIGGDTVDQSELLTHRYSYVEGRLYIAMIMASGDRKTLVYDPQIEAWTFYALSMNFARTLSPLSGATRSYFLSPSGIEVLDGATTDNGTAIAWSWKSGRYALADPGKVAVAPESSLVGYGTVTLRLDSDLYTNQAASAALGTYPAVAEGWPSPVDQEGTWVQATVSGSAAGGVSRITHLVSSVKPTGVR